MSTLIPTYSHCRDGKVLKRWAGRKSYKRPVFELAIWLCATPPVDLNREFDMLLATLPNSDTNLIPTAAKAAGCKFKGGVS